MSAEKCPVCGAPKTDVDYYACGKCPVRDCQNAERLAIERAAEVERLRGVLEQIMHLDDLVTVGPHIIDVSIERRLAKAVSLASDALKET